MIKTILQDFKNAWIEFETLQSVFLGLDINIFKILIFSWFDHLLKCTSKILILLIIGGIISAYLILHTSGVGFMIFTKLMC